MAEIFIHIAEPQSQKKPAWALWNLGFRPFYLLAALWAALSIPIWVLQLSGRFSKALIRSPSWHAHEMIFGFILPVIIGFLFTAGRNWSGHPTPTGRKLQLLALLWLLARGAAFTPWLPLSLLLNLSVAWMAAWGLWQSLQAGRNHRNYFFVLLLIMMGMTSVAFHLNELGWLQWPKSIGVPLALDIVLLIVTIMMGRVVPMFSNNGIAGINATRKAFVEKLVISSTVGLFLIDGYSLNSLITMPWISLTFIAHAWRWLLWQPWKARRNAMVWVLHAAYFWLLFHLVLKAMASAGWIATGPSIHALTVGLVGMITLGMMTRTALGHTGHPIHATWAEQCAFTAVAIAACIRVIVPLLWPALLIESAILSSGLWSLAFGLFLWRYTPLLVRPRLDGLPG